MRFESAFAIVAGLVRTFQAGDWFHLSPSYREQEARRDFIDRFFTTLGWDVICEQGYAQLLRINCYLGRDDGS